MSELLTTRQAVEMIGWTRQRMYAARYRSYAPPATKLPNGDLRFRRQDVEEWLARREADRKRIEGLWTAEQTAEWLEVAIGTLWWWRHEGKGPPTVEVEGQGGTNRRVYYDPDDVRAWADRRKAS